MRTHVPSRVLLALAALAALAGVAFAVHQLRQPGAPSFSSETAYLDTAPPHGGRVVRVSSAPAFEDAVDRARAGETIEVSGRVRVPGEFRGFDRVVPGGTVDVVLGPQVTFTGGSSSDPAVFVQGAGGWRVWGGRVTNPGGGGILVYASPGPFTWTGFRVTGTAGGCVSVFPVGGNVDRVVLAGMTGTARPDLALDPHSEKGTGIQAWNIADAAGGGLVEHSTFAADVVDQATGAAVEIDTGHVGPGVTVYARARHLGFGIPGTTWNGDAQRQVAGNVIQLWGGTPHGSLDLRYVEGADIQGRLVDTTGVVPGTDLSRVTVGYAHATGPILQNPRVSGPPTSEADGLRVDGARPG